ncbi:nucleoside phosphorylase domain-containing protein [Aspergillus alliaceus]|uniref:Nucleoside phosphorylase domain-containing protein n=1 Tax=Petromyces alliaceus TaxID=209559 RepID=A0A5N7CC39_PETAA|nr:nucleoside phosphorylase domain-containing protein [Aspergillus alliaceus]
MVGTAGRPNDSEFTVGWVCALFKEYIAAVEVLDEAYDRTRDTSLTSDGNSYYTRGRIGGHNVVVGCLPAGRYGLVSTSGVAEDMRSRFPGIKLGVIVGIGGGVPSAKNDVRLGDVVIGTKVVQYGLGKKTSTGFLVTGHTFTPPPILLHAVTGLKTRLFDGLDLGSRMDEAFTKSPPIKATFGRPDWHTDRLYTPEYVHTDECDCTNSCAQRPNDVVKRPIREKGQIRVHDGVIASADQVMKDATTRDEIARELDAICFEMEAAGLSDSFRWIAIRGICDYSDSHKNDQWHGYAAASAAACAKELLLTIPPGDTVGTECVGQVDQRRLVVPDFIRMLQTTPSGLAMAMQSALVGVCVLLAIFGQLIWSTCIWVLSTATSIQAPEWKVSANETKPGDSSKPQFRGSPIHINIHVAHQPMSSARRQSEIDWTDSQDQCPTEFSTVQWDTAAKEKVLDSTAVLLQEVRSLMNKEAARNISIDIPHYDGGSPSSPLGSSCDPLEREPWQRPEIPLERTDSVSTTSKPPVPPRSKKPRGYVSRRNTQIPVPNSMARKNKYSSEHNKNKDTESCETSPEILAIINEFRGRASV